MSASQTASRDDRSPARSTGLAARTVAPGQAFDLSVIIPTRNEAGNIRTRSPLATRFAKGLLRPELAGISDPMSGFFLVRRSCLDLSALHPQGFKLLLELLVHNPRASVTEVPYTFGVRHAGASKA